MRARIQAWLDQEDARITSVIRRHGWAIEYIGGGCCSAPGCDGGEDEGPPFAYTVGLFGMGHPELLVLGLDPATALRLLNTLGERIRADETLLPGRLLTIEGWDHRVVPEEVPNPGEIVFSANRFYQRPSEFSVPVLQLSHDNIEGRFPWEAGFADPDLQPRPGEFRA
ncbi:MAG TPA: DUF4262 domain-containing protein [Acidimicrobiia bacterium]|nr:DUF4262 domain-containing protein [Acidimicrobiia bacterium]